MLLFVLLYSSIWACTCITPPVKASLLYSDAVFVGRLIKIVDSTNMYYTGEAGLVSFANFEVIRYLRGLQPQNRIVSILSESNCSLRFSKSQIGDTLLIYARNYTSAFAGLLTCGQCSNSKPVSQISDAEELKVYRDVLQWKTPRRHLLEEEKTALRVRPGKAGEEGRKTPDYVYVLVVLLSLNLLLTAVLLFRKK